MTSRIAAWHLVTIGSACALPVVGAFLVSTGLFTIDEFIYLSASDAMARNASLIVDNGYSQFGSDDLKLWFLIGGPNGLTPQYPPGMALLSAPLYMIMGARSLIMVNALAAAGVILLTYKLGRRLYGSESVALGATLILLLGTFLLEYAWSIWPHMASLFFVTLAFYLAMDAEAQDQRRAAYVRAFVSGLAVGAAMLIRTDSVLVLPIIACCIILYSTRPVTTILSGAIGLIPAMIAGALINQFKFGTFNFLSYGRPGTGGGVDMMRHVGPALLVFCLLLGLVAARHLTWSKRWFRVLLVTVIVAGVAAFFLPELSRVLQRVGNGFHRLFLDMRAVSETLSGIVPLEDGSLLFWGAAKKAMGQSMPWLGVTAVLLFSRWPRDSRPAHLCLVIFVAVWSMPFVALSWHGGLSSNMRYFLPMLPPLAVLCSALIHQLASSTSSPWTFVIFGAVAGTLASTTLFLWEGVQLPVQQQSVSLKLFLVVLIVVSIASVTPVKRAFFQALACVVVGVGLGAGFFNSVVVDVTFSQVRRVQALAVSNWAATITGPTLFYGRPRMYASAVSRPDSIVGLDDWTVGNLDRKLFQDALESGHRAFITIHAAEAFAAQPGFRVADKPLSPDGGTIEVFLAE